MGILTTYSTAKRDLKKRSFSSSMLLATLLVIACSSQSSDGGKREAANPRGKTVLGQPDNASGSGLTIDEAKITGSITDSELALKIPVSLQSGSATGKLSIQLLDLVSGAALTKSDAPYQLDASSPQTIATSLALPAGLNRQAPLVQYVLRIDAADQGLSVKRSLLYAPQPYELRLEGPSTPRRDKKAVYRVVTQDPRSHQPLSQIPVSLSIKQDGQAASNFAGKSDDFGVFEQELTLASVGQVTSSLLRPSSSRS